VQSHLSTQEKESIESAIFTRSHEGRHINLEPLGPQSVCDGCCGKIQCCCDGCCDAVSVQCVQTSLLGSCRYLKHTVMSCRACITCSVACIIDIGMNMPTVVSFIANSCEPQFRRLCDSATEAVDSFRQYMPRRLHEHSNWIPLRETPPEYRRRLFRMTETLRKFVALKPDWYVPTLQHGSWDTTK